MMHYRTRWLCSSLVLAMGCGGSPPPSTQRVPPTEPEPALAVASPPPSTPGSPPAEVPYRLEEPTQEQVTTPEPSADAGTWSTPDRPLVARTRTLRPFTSVRSMEQFARANSGDTHGWNGYGGVVPRMPIMMGTSGALAGLSRVSASSAAPAPDSITSQQVTGIDEGDIVKRLGDHMVVLRQGVLYAISTVGTLSVQDRMVVQRPGEAEGWLDELIVHEGTRRVVVTGFVEGVEELPSTLYKLFTLGADGRFARGEAIYLRSSDYYSEDNYATRLLGDQLVLYSVHELNLAPVLEREEFVGLTPEQAERLREEARWDRELPAVRIGDAGPFRRAWDPRGVHRLNGGRATTLHAITSCDLRATPLTCRSRGVMAQGESMLFVSHTATYLFMADASFEEPPGHAASDEAYERFEASAHVHPLYRLPHAGEAPRVTPVVGRPVGPLSFMESGDTLHVVLDVSDVPAPDGQRDAPQVALAVLPLRDFGRRVPTQREFRPLPGSSLEMVRFIGTRSVLYSTRGRSDRLFAHDLAAGTTQVLYDGIGHGRIDPLGDQGALVSWNERAELRYLTLDMRGAPRVTEHRRIPSSGTAETRTHGFFYRPDADGGSFGMPLVVQQGETRSLVAFFDVRDFHTRLVGELTSQPVAPQRCRHSCFDWYGNSRPIFWGERVFALLGPEVVEGIRFDGRIQESGRVVMTPPDDDAPTD